MGGVCRKPGRGKCTGFCWESQKEGDHSEDRGVDGMGSEWILERLSVGVRVDQVGSG
jgi:hypothetical protein